jgi:hypothetical protein
MASATDLLTLGSLEKASVYSATSEAAGYPKERLLDWNPDVFWKPTSTADQTIVLDLGAAQQVDRLAIWCHNYTTSHIGGGGQQIRVSYSASVGSGYTTWMTNILAQYMNGSFPIVLFQNGLTAQTYRYWKIEFLNMTTTIEVSGIFLCRKYTLIANQWPERDKIVYANRKVEGPGGRLFVGGINRNSYRIIQRTFYMTQTSHFTALQDAWDNSRGCLLPLILSETDGIGNKFVRFTDDALDQNKTGHQLWSPTIDFRQIPHIYPGEAL